MRNRVYNDLIAWLQGQGFVYDRTNGKQVEFWTRVGCAEVSVHPSIAEHVARNLRRRVEKKLGQQTAGDRVKRHPVQIKDRRAKSREQVADELRRHEEEIQRLLGRRDELLSGLGAVLSAGEVAQIEACIEEHEREAAEWRRLITEVPKSAGRVAHVAGAR